MSTDGLNANTESLVELNPKLADVSHHTRIAYAKFMTTKLKKEINFEDEKVTVENEKIRARESKAFNKFKTHAGILKKARIGLNEELKQPTEEKVKEKVSIVEHHAEPTQSPAPSVNDDDLKDFRARTPIQEDPNEDVQTPDRCLTPEHILDEPVPQISSSPISTTASPTATSSPSLDPLENRKADSPIVKLKSQSETPESSIKSPEPTMVKTPDLSKTDEEEEEEEDEDEKTEKPKKDSKSSTNLTVPSVSNRPNSPAPSLSTGDKGKSKITGKTLTGWI